MKKLNAILLRLAGVNIPTYSISDIRSKKLILALSYFLYISSFLCGYAMYVSVYFLLDNLLVSFIIGATIMVLMVWHDQSLLSTSRIYQIVLKLLFSLFLAISFTVTSNTEKYAEALKEEIIQSDNKHNASVLDEINRKVDEIDQEELNIMHRIEEASRVYDETGKKQRLIDARRSLAAFNKTKDDRKERILNSYEDKVLSSEVTQLDLLGMQARKMMDGEEGTFVAIVLTFLFFMLESLPVIIRLLLNGSDYIIRHHSDLKSVESLRDQSIDCRHTFIAAEGDIIKELFTIDIIEEKRRLILNNFQDKELMRTLAYRKKLLDNGFDPYTGKSLDDIDFSFLFVEDNADETEHTTQSKKSENEDHAKSNGTHEEEPIFEF